jgi:glycosyltransferase involved in cell wall biosynthesis
MEITIPRACFPTAGRKRLAALLLAVGAALFYATFGRRLAAAARSRPLTLRSRDHQLSSATPGELCRGAYRACWEWKTAADVSALNLEVVLVGNELYQQLPTTGYGGIETSVDNLAQALHAMGIPFFAIVPGRREKYELPFTVLETEVAPNGKQGQVETYVEQVREILRAELAKPAARRTPPSTTTTTTASSSSTASTAAAAAAPQTAAPHRGDTTRRFVIWGQSMWSQAFSEFAAAEIVSHHDGGGPKRWWKWNEGRANVRHRFLSQDQMAQWVDPSDKDAYAVNAPVSRVIPHGLPLDAYKLCVDKGYFLWVAGLDWGWEEKGIDIFIEMAKARPQYKFVAYGAARERKDLVVRLYEVMKEVPNFEFRGELKRGGMHLQAFCEATAFVMPTHESIGESFGMTVIESLSKGVPVIASTNGAVPEILAVEGRKGVSPYGTTCEGKDYDCYLRAADTYWERTKERSEEVRLYAWNKFDVHLIADRFLNYSLATLREVGVVGAGGGGAAGRG